MSLKFDGPKDWTIECQKLIAQLDLLIRILGYSDMFLDLSHLEHQTLNEVLESLEDFIKVGGNP